MNANKQDAGGLLLCPWCRVLPEERTLPSGGGSYYFAVRCRNWDCPVQPETDEFETPQEASAAWNRRNGEQCRAASGFLRIVEEMESACCSYAGPDVDYTVDASTVYRWAEALRALSRGVPEVEPFVSCTCHEERQKQLCLNKHRCVRAYPLAAIAAQRKDG